MTLITGIMIGVLIGYLTAAFFINISKYDFTKFTKGELRQIIIDVRDELHRRSEGKNDRIL